MDSRGPFPFDRFWYLRHGHNNYLEDETEAKIVIESYNRQRFLLECLKALDDGGRIVVTPPTRLPSLQEPLLHLQLWAV